VCTNGDKLGGLRLGLGLVLGLVVWYDRGDRPIVNDRPAHHFHYLPNSGRYSLVCEGRDLK